VKLDSAEQYARLPGGAAATVTFTGQIAIDALPVERSVVTLIAASDNGWMTRVSPVAMVFTNTIPQNFTCIVTVPAGTLWNQTCNLVIRGHAKTGDWESFAETHGVVRVEPYFRIVLQTPKPITTINQGKQAFFTVLVGNLGNSIDSFEVEIANLDELRSTGWAAVISGGTLPKVEPGEYKPIRLTAQSPRDDWSIDNKVVDIEFKVTSQNAKDYQEVVNQTITLTVQARSVWLANLSPYLVLVAIIIVVVCIARVSGRKQALRR
jgi:hypothetical protein